MKTPTRTRTKAAGRDPEPRRRVVRKATSKKAPKKRTPTRGTTNVPRWLKTTIPAQYNELIIDLNDLLNQEYEHADDGVDVEEDLHEDDFRGTDETLADPEPRDFVDHREAFLDGVEAKVAAEFIVEGEDAVVSIDAVVVDRQTIKIYDMYDGWREGPWWAVMASLVKKLTQAFKAAETKDRAELALAREQVIEKRRAIQEGLVNRYVTRVKRKGLLNEGAEKAPVKGKAKTKKKGASSTAKGLDDKTSPLGRMDAVLGDD